VKWQLFLWGTGGESEGLEGSSGGRGEETVLKNRSRYQFRKTMGGIFLTCWQVVGGTIGELPKGGEKGLNAISEERRC